MGGSFHGYVSHNQMVSQNGLIHIFLGMIHFSQEWWKFCYGQPIKVQTGGRSVSCSTHPWSIITTCLFNGHSGSCIQYPEHPIFWDQPLSSTCHQLVLQSDLFKQTFEVTWVPKKGHLTTSFSGHFEESGSIVLLAKIPILAGWSLYFVAEPGRSW